MPALAVDLDASPAAPVAYAEEIVATVTTPVTLSNVGGVLDLSTPLAYNFTQGEVRYARVECPAHVRFLAGSGVVASDAPSAAISGITGLGGSAITFSVTALTTGLTATDRLTITGDREVTAAEDADCRFALYDLPSQAQAGGPVGRVVDVAGRYIDFAPSFAFRVDSVSRATADVEGIEGPYTRFLTEAPTNDATRGLLGGVSYGTAADVLGVTQPLVPSGVAATLADVMGAATALVFGGDFEPASPAFLSDSASCANTVAVADSTDARQAVFTLGTGDAVGRFLCFGAGSAEIQAGEYTVSFEPEAASADYAPQRRGPATFGEIVRNGTELIAPFVQPGEGRIARIVLVNTGADKRRFSLRLLAAASGSASEPESLYIGLTSSDGTIPAEGSVVVNLADAFPLERFQGAPRGAIRAIVSGPNAQIQGVYQVVDPQRGSIDSHVMVRPGSN